MIVIKLLHPLPDRLQNDSEESIQTIPTIGFNVEVLQYKNIKFQVSYFRRKLKLLWLTSSFCIGLGPWRPDQHSALLEVLLSEYRRDRVCRRQLWCGPSKRCPTGANGDAGGRWAEGFDFAGLCEQTGFKRSAQCSAGSFNCVAAPYSIVITNIHTFTLLCMQVSEAMGLPEIKNRQWSIQETSALKGTGLFDGFDWYVVSHPCLKLFVTECMCCCYLIRLVTCIKGGES